MADADTAREEQEQAEEESEVEEEKQGDSQPTYSCKDRGDMQEDLRLNRNTANAGDPLIKQEAPFDARSHRQRGERIRA